MQETTEHRRQRFTLRARIRIAEAVAEHRPEEREKAQAHAEAMKEQLAQLETEAHPLHIVRQRINQYAERQ